MTRPADLPESHGKETRAPVTRPASPAVRRRQLAAELRAIRVSRNRSGDRVATALGWSPSKISRWELARGSPKPADLEKLLDYYQVTGPRRDLLLSLAQDAARKGWWEDDAIPPAYQDYIAYEHEATAIAIWRVEAVPGLLQTAAYTRHLITGYGQVDPIPPGQVDRLVRARMRRQHILDRDTPPTLQVVLDESVLRRRIGDHTVMRDQLAELAAHAAQPHITVQILPLDAAHPLASGSFDIFSFGPRTAIGDVVSAEPEHLTGGRFIDDERDTYLHRLAFGTLTAAALDPDASRALIDDTARSSRPAPALNHHLHARHPAPPPATEDHL
jgi:transcriptional regulator with XRE-family HTH domain